MSTRKPKYQGRQITVDGKPGKIIYANSVEVLIQFEDNSRTRIAKDRADWLLMKHLIP